MIHYHGTPITPGSAAVRALRGRHAFVSFAAPEQLGLVIEVAQTFSVDCGSFSAWKSGVPITDWRPYYDWVSSLRRVPSCDWAIIPDVIDGNESANDRLIDEWPHGTFGVPVWHLHESLDRLARLTDSWPRVCLGSSGDYSSPGTRAWWIRIMEAMGVVCDDLGRPKTKLHGLRMLNGKIFSKIPFSSCDSTNVARNIGIDKRWTGTYQPPNKDTRAWLIAEMVEGVNAPDRWVKFDLGDDSIDEPKQEEQLALDLLKAS